MSYIDALHHIEERRQGTQDMIKDGHLGTCARHPRRNHKTQLIFHVTTTTDISWDSYDVDIWAAVELNTGMFCIAAPAVKPLLRQISPGLLSSIESKDISFPT